MRPEASALVVGCTALIQLQVAAAARPPPRNPGGAERRSRHVPLHSDHNRGPSRPEGAALDVGMDGTARSLAQNADIDGRGGYEFPSEQLRADLLSNYDRNAYPWQTAWEVPSDSSLRKGIPVEIGINFHKVRSVDVKSSTADLIVWFRQRWTDPRLKWDPANYGNLTTAHFWIGDGIAGGETSEIWTPDLELWNMEVSLQDSLADAYGLVSNDGVVFWSRPGHLRAACKFEGLDKFPFDMLGCTMEFGSWTYSGLYLRPTKMDGIGFSIGGSDTAGQSYSEYRLPHESEGEEAVRCTEKVYPPYPMAPEEDWPVLLYHVSFKRSWQPYVRGYVLMQVVLNAAGFSAFWLPVQCGERMSLSITALLAAVASELVVASSLPSAAEMTWFQSFSLFSLSFAALSLFECVVVLYFFYFTGKDLRPRWWSWIWERARWMLKPKPAPKQRKVRQAEDVWHDNARAKTAESSAKSGNARGGQQSASCTSNAKHSVLNDVIDELQVTEIVEDTSESKGSAICRRRSLSWDGAPVALHDAAEAEAEMETKSDSGLPRPERPSVPRDSLYEESLISLMGATKPRDADDFINSDEATRNVRWKQVAQAIDEVCRVVVPITYLVILAVLMSSAHY